MGGRSAAAESGQVSPLTGNMTASSDTHRRAEVRGRLSVAMWRINSGVWAARLFAVIFVVFSILPLLRRETPNIAGTITLALIAIWLLVGSELLRGGSRPASVLLLVAYIAAKLASWLVTGAPIYSGWLWTFVMGGAFVNAVWGTFELEAVRRAALLVPPAPPRPSRRTYI